MKRLFCALITIPVLAGCVAGSFDEQFARAQADAQAMTLRMFGGPIISAAEQGDVKSQYTLGVMYMEGQGAPQDYAEALKWFRLAAMQGHADAQHNLGYMYDNGLGVPQERLIPLHPVTQYEGATQLSVGERVVGRESALCLGLSRVAPLRA